MLSIPKITGGSGCELKVFEKNGNLYVRKISKSQDYDLRLERQCAKQVGFVHPFLLTPKVVESGITDTGRFFFDMEYIDGLLMSDWVKGDLYNEELIRQFVDYLLFYYVDKSDAEVPISLFHDKIRQLFALENKSTTVKAALDFLLKCDWSGFPQGKCHGDLNFDNIIIKDNQIYIFDFLDSFCDSPIIDCAKLLQDVDSMWAFRNHDSLQDYVVKRLSLFRSLIFEKLADADAMKCCQTHLLHLVRIFPYIKDENEICYLENCIDLLIANMNNRYSYCS